MLEHTAVARKCTGKRRRYQYSRQNSARMPAIDPSADAIMAMCCSERIMELCGRNIDTSRRKHRRKYTAGTLVLLCNKFEFVLKILCITIARYTGGRPAMKITDVVTQQRLHLQQTRLPTKTARGSNSSQDTPCLLTKPP